MSCSFTQDFEYRGVGIGVIIEWLWLESTFKGHLLQPTYSDQGHLQVVQVAQGPVQP